MYNLILAAQPLEQLSLDLDFDDFVDQFNNLLIISLNTFFNHDTLDL